METPDRDVTTAASALDALARDTGDTAALDTLAHCDVLVPVPEDATDEDVTNPSMLALPVLEQPGSAPIVPVFTSEPEMVDLLPGVDRYRVVPLGALAHQWPEGELSLSIDAAGDHPLTLTSEGVRTLLAR
ncbi:SseB family protein [Streptomyces phaeoluteigriseus]|uniref:SseB family protein n=1 Tax=Streptomyces phaeoluteigriseus TaxID=114686 RepID=A0ABY4ZE53_9ACTN|nr:SseB family protein [Streptomyces phaeoluteigriseus]USQ86592.1 SseB family protein [Streptomyces phaeoluteigriseus]